MSVTVIFDLEMKTRDGVTLRSDVYLPDRKGKYPLIVLRSPYNADDPVFSRYCAEFCKQGIGVVCQSTRGTGASDGDFNISRQECEDGEDFLNWIAEQDFCNGNIVTNGESYPGHTQWQLARHGHSVMKGLTPHNAPLEFYSVAMRTGGAWGFGLATVWAFGTRLRRLHSDLKIDWNTMRWHLPLADLDTAIGLEKWQVWQDWMQHVTRDEFWRGSADAMSAVPNVTAPAFITGGWFDAFLPQTLQVFSEMRKNAGSEQARKFTRLVMEPLDHDMRTHDIDYGPEHLAGIIKTRNRFMANILKDPENDPLPDQPPAHLFVMGSNKWIDAEEWPLPETQYTNVYLRGCAPANSVAGSGKLSFDAPAGNDEITEHFYYNPMEPVPTWGGCTLGIAVGQRWQDDIEKRSDVLVFTSEPLTEDLDVIGNVKAVIYAATDGKDTDFTVKVCDVGPDGRSINLCDGLLRGRFLNGFDEEILLEPGKAYAYGIDCWATSWTFLKGHRIRVQVSSSNFPRFDRNLNTGLHLTRSSELRIASQTVFHNADMPSHVILPVIPRKK